MRRASGIASAVLLALGAAPLALLTVVAASDLVHRGPAAAQSPDSISCVAMFATASLICVAGAVWFYRKGRND